MSEQIENTEKRIAAAQALGWKEVDHGIGANRHYILGDELIDGKYYIVDRVFPVMSNSIADSIINLRAQLESAKKAQEWLQKYVQLDAQIIVLPIESVRELLELTSKNGKAAE